MSPITDNGADAPSLPPANSVGSPEIIDGSVGVIDLSAGVQSEFVNVTGDTMTGSLTMTGQSILDAASVATQTLDVGEDGVSDGNIGQFVQLVTTPLYVAKLWGDADSRVYLDPSSLQFGDGANAPSTGLSFLSTGVLGLETGNQLRVDVDPAVDNDLARKKYVDDEVAGVDLTSRVAKAGDTMTGKLIINSPGTGPLELVGTAGTTPAFAPGIKIGPAYIYQHSGSEIRHTFPETFVAGQPASFRPNALSKEWSFNPGHFRADNNADGIAMSTRDLSVASQDQWQIRFNGKQQWGAGAGTFDVGLARVAANTLQLDAGDTLQVQQDPVLDNDVARKKYVDDEVSGAASATDLSDHINDTVDAHDASAISNVPLGGIVATDVQAAIDELSSEKLDKAGGTMTGSLTMNTGANIISNQPGSPSNSVLESKHTGTFDAFRINADGRHLWDTNSDGAPDIEIRPIGTNLIVWGSTSKIQQNAAPTVDDDLANKKYVDDEVAGVDFTGILKMVDHVAGAGQTTTSSTHQTYMTLTFTAVAGVEYEVEAHIKWRHSVTTSDTNVRLQDTTNVATLDFFQEKTSDGNSDQQLSSTLKKIKTFPAGSTTLEVQFAAIDAAGTSVMDLGVFTIKEIL